MLVSRVMKMTIVAVIVVWGADAAPRRGPPKFKVCGRDLSHLMSQVCQAYNSPSPTWDVPTVIEQPAPVVRKRRGAGGIADECCKFGCEWRELIAYCSVVNSEVLKALDTHLIADRSAEQENGGSGDPAVPAMIGEETLATKKPHEKVALLGTASVSGSPGSTGARREVGNAQSRGYGRARRGRRCWCRRKRRTGRRRAQLMGNMSIVRNVPRAAPVVGTVSPFLTWGRTLNTDLPQIERDRYAYSAVYTT